MMIHSIFVCINILEQLFLSLFLLCAPTHPIPVPLFFYMFLFSCTTQSHHGDIWVKGQGPVRVQAVFIYLLKTSPMTRIYLVSLILLYFLRGRLHSRHCLSFTQYYFTSSTCFTLQTLSYLLDDCVLCVIMVTRCRFTSQPDGIVIK